MPPATSELRCPIPAPHCPCETSPAPSGTAAPTWGCTWAALRARGVLSPKPTSPRWRCGRVPVSGGRDAGDPGERDEGDRGGGGVGGEDRGVVPGAGHVHPGAGAGDGQAVPDAGGGCVFDHGAGDGGDGADRAGAGAGGGGGGRGGERGGGGGGGGGGGVDGGGGGGGGVRGGDGAGEAGERDAAHA